MAPPHTLVLAAADRGGGHRVVRVTSDDGVLRFRFVAAPLGVGCLLFVCLFRGDIVDDDFVQALIQRDVLSLSLSAVSFRSALCTV